jgi:MFS family permease
MTSDDNEYGPLAPRRRTLFYGWVIVVACTIIQIAQYGIQYSFSVFFKPLADDFSWSRGATSGAYSVLMVCAGASAIPLGWLADKIGPARVMMACSLITGLAVVLASRVTELWQLYATFGIMLGLGMGGTMAICGGVTARWFVKQRGTALGIVSAGIGLGTFIMPPIAEQLISAFDWPKAYIIIGIGTGIVTVIASSLLRRSPDDMGQKPYGHQLTPEQPGPVLGQKEVSVTPAGILLKKAIGMKTLWLLAFMFFCVNICVQVIMVHLVNYATDQGIAPLTAATLVSVIGVGGVVGRLFMGSVSDRIGAKNAALITCTLLLASLLLLLFSSQIWLLYAFAILFGFAYGGEVPQMTLLISQFFGLQAVMALTGAVSAATRAGGALGSWAGGHVYDVTRSYSFAFATIVVVAAVALVTAISLKRSKP